MTRFLSGLLLILAALVLGYLASPIPFYLQSKEARLKTLWSKDLVHLAQNKDFANTFKQISKTEIYFSDPQIAEDFSQLNVPITLNPQGPLVLKVSITRWIDKNKYGFIVEHNIFDKDDDKIFEFGRTYHIGYIF